MFGDIDWSFLLVSPIFYYFWCLLFVDIAFVWLYIMLLVFSNAWIYRWYVVVVIEVKLVYYTTFPVILVLFTYNLMKHSDQYNREDITCDVLAMFYMNVTDF